MPAIKQLTHDEFNAFIERTVAVLREERDNKHRRLDDIGGEAIHSVIMALLWAQEDFQKNAKRGLDYRWNNEPKHG